MVLFSVRTPPGNIPAGINIEWRYFAIKTFLNGAILPLIIAINKHTLPAGDLRDLSQFFNDTSKCKVLHL